MRWVIVLLVAPTLWGAASVAAPTRPTKPTALTLFRSGKQLFAVHEYAVAIKSFEASQLRAPHPNNLYFIGECYRRLGKLRLAHAYYTQFAVTAPAKRRAELKRKLEQLRVGRTSRLVLRSTPNGATVFVDGQRRGFTPSGNGALTLELAGGVHQLRITLAGHRPHHEQLRAEFGEPIEVRATLEAPEATTPPPSAALKALGSTAGSAFVRAGLGFAATWIADAPQLSGAPIIEAAAGYRWGAGRYSLEVHGLLSATFHMADGEGQSTVLLVGAGALVRLASHVWIGLRLSAGLALLSGVNTKSPLFTGADEVNPPFSLFVLRSMMPIEWHAGERLVVGLAPSFEVSPRHPDFAPDVGSIFRLGAQGYVGWKWR